MRTLTHRELAILALEREWFRQRGGKEQAILEQTGLTATEYYAELNRIIDTSAALEYDPMLVKRLQRLRAHRAKLRAG